MSTKQKFREILLIDISGEIASPSSNAVPLLMHSIDEVQKVFLLSVISTLVDGKREKLQIKIGKVICKEAEGVKIHECLKKAKFSIYKVMDADTFTKLT
jgi:hypothetical protein